MFRFLSTYRKHLVFALVILLAIPCSVKKEMKQWLQIETSQLPNTGKAKIACTINYKLKQIAEREHAQKKFHPHIPQPEPQKISFFPTPTILTGLFISLKEKIPSFIRFEQFLI